MYKKCFNPFIYTSAQIKLSNFSCDKAALRGPWSISYSVQLDGLVTWIYPLDGFCWHGMVLDGMGWQLMTFEGISCHWMVFDGSSWHRMA